MARTNRLSPNQRLLELIRKPADAPSASAPAGVTAKAASSASGGAGGTAPRAWLSAMEALRRLRPLHRGVSVGVDISPESVSCVKIRGRDADFDLLGAVVTPVPEGVTPESPAFMALLRRTLSDLCGPGPAPAIWAAVQSARANLQFVTIPKVASKQVDNAVYWTAKKEMAFDEAGVIFDFERRGEVAEKGTTRLGAMAYAAPRADVEAVRAAFAKAGFPLTGVSLEPFAHQNFFRRRLVPQAGETTANLHVGRNWSRLEIYSNGDLMFVRVIKTSMAGMMQAVQEALESRLAVMAQTPPPAADAADAPGELDLPFAPEMAEGAPLPDPDASQEPGDGLVLELDAAPAAPMPQAPPPPPKVDRAQLQELFDSIIYGCDQLDACHPGAGLDPEDVMGMLEPVASRLVRQVEMTLKHYRESLGYEAVTRLTVSGPLGASQLFLNYIGEQTGLPCVSLDPLRGRRVRAIGGNGGDRQGPAWTQALGLAFSDPAITPNALFTYTAKAAVRASRMLEQCAIVGLAVVLLAMAYFSFHLSHRARDLGRQRDQLASQLASLGGSVDIKQLTRQLASLRERREALRSFARRNQTVGIFQQALSLAPDGVAVGTLTSEIGPPAAPAPAKGKGGHASQPAGQPGRLILEGMITGDPRLFDSMLTSYVVAWRVRRSFMTSRSRKANLRRWKAGRRGSASSCPWPWRSTRS